MYLGSWDIDDNLTFPANTHTPSTGAATDADAVPDYAVYEDETGAEILSGSMAKLDDAGTTGFYSEQIALTAANGFEAGKCYTIYVSAAVGGVTGTMSHTFQVLAEVNVAKVEDGDPTDQINAACDTAISDYAPSTHDDPDPSGYIDAAVSSRASHDDPDPTGLIARLALLAAGGSGELTGTRAALLDNLDAAVSGRATPAQVDTEVDEAIENYHLDHLFAADYDPASKPGTATALLNEIVENDGGVARFTANALEQAPSGSAGAGATSTTYTLTDGTNPIADADVWVTTDEAGSNVVASGTTNDSGEVTFMLDSGTTYYVWRQKAGWDFTNPDTETA